MITIDAHRVHLNGSPVEWMPSPNIGGRMEPQLIVLHETASHLDRGNAARWLCNKASKVSAHFTIERDGSIIQLVACDTVAQHAGKSSWQGRSNCNAYSVGIEIVGPGKLAKHKSTGVAWFGKSWPLEELVEVDSPSHGGVGLWLPFTDAQIAATEALVAALIAAYPRVVDVVGHFEIGMPIGRKVDPSPLYPIADCKALCYGRPMPLDQPVVKTAQRKLLDLGYDVGLVDGLIGPRVRKEVRAFQEQNGLPMTGELDSATLSKLADVDAAAMTTGTRAMVTKGEAATPETKAIKRTTEVGAAMEIAQASVSAQDAIGKLSKAKSSGEQVSAVLGWVTSPAGIRTLFVLGALGVVWWAANRVDWALLTARIKGLTLRGQ